MWRPRGHHHISSTRVTAVLLFIAACVPAPVAAATSAASSTAHSGYWTLGHSGTVYSFGDAPHYGNASAKNATHLEPTPTGKGYWIVDAEGRVWAFGDAVWRGNAAAMRPGERVSSLSRTPSGKGYWLFTSAGRVLPFGDAKLYGDMRGTALNGSIVGSAVTPTGHGYYMVGTDGGIFAFGDARFYGSTGAAHLNRPVNGLVPTPDNGGYWLVASDGGIFAFGNAPFRGSMGSVRLNQPVIGMVRYGNGYLMVASDGGIFDFSNQPFLGSLGGKPLGAPIIGVASAPAVPAVGAPSAVTDLSAAPGNAKVTVTFTLPASHASAISEVKYTATGGSGSVAGAWSSPGSSGQPVSKTINGLVNGTTYSVTVSACNEAGKCGPDSNAVSGANTDPYGPPNPPSVSASQSGNSIVYNWSGGGNNGRPVADYGVCIDGSCTSKGAAAGATTIGYGCSTNHSIYAYVTDTVGQKSGNSTTATASTQTSAPPGAVTVSWGSAAPASGCGGDASCTYLNVSWSGLSGGSHTLTAYFDGGNWGAGPFTVSGTSGSYNGHFWAGYCNQSHSVRATIDSTSSNTINTNQHSCPPSGAATVSWGGQAPASGCSGDPSCTYLNVSWSGLSAGSHTLTAYFDGGNWGAGPFTVSGTSGSYNGHFWAGYCNQSHTARVTVGSTGSNTINTNQHSC